MKRERYDNEMQQNILNKRCCTLEKEYTKLAKECNNIANAVKHRSIKLHKQYFSDLQSRNTLRK